MKIFDIDLLLIVESPYLLEGKKAKLHEITNVTAGS